MAYESLTYDALLQRTRLFRTEYFERAAELMNQLATAGQKPQVLIVSCADSRVVPEFIAKARPGDVFVVRNVANIVPAYSISESAVGAVLEYAVRHLHVGHLVVCGHTDCGGIKAMDKRLDPLKEPALARWLEQARPIVQRVDGRGIAADLRHRALVEENIRLQLEHAQTYACVREAVQQGKLALHGWVYDVATGQVAVVE
jgi:carbonic anhydrase